MQWELRRCRIVREASAGARTKPAPVVTGQEDRARRNAVGAAGPGRYEAPVSSEFAAIKCEARYIRAPGGTRYDTQAHTERLRAR